WFGLHAWYRNQARIRDVRIVGEPVVPDEISLSSDPELRHWLPYFDEAIGYNSARWGFLPDPEGTGMIVGRRDRSLTGSSAESLLRYMRPMMEDGTIEYEFRYEPGEFAVHPALGRLAFLLQPDGMRLHWITDDRYDATDVAPENSFVPERWEKRPLPLRAGEWNRLQLSVVDSTVAINLNGSPICELTLPATISGSRRVFGFFRYADQSDVQVRNVTMRGDWPKSVPPLQEQPLARKAVLALDAQHASLPAVYDMNFANSGFDSQMFSLRNARGGGQFSMQNDGFQIVRPASNAWTATELLSRIVVRGDFDVSAGFSDFEAVGDEDAAAMVIVKLDDEPQHHLRAVRNRVKQLQRQYYQVSKSVVQADGQRSYDTTSVPFEATTGTLRIARRGSEIYYLFAEGDSLNFHLVGQKTASDADGLGIDLNAIANGTSTVTVTWNSLHVAAEELLLLPGPDDQPQNEIFVMNADGTDVRSVTGHISAIAGA
ncbi:MAG: DUF1583 domain-containing protein, partial [Planctomycetaceae bacterium]|nr:DUF1583 domain-containing protein [Planctomycetaceae bacterium]